MLRFSRCIREIRSSKFRGRGSCLDEPQFLNYVCFMFVVINSEQCFYVFWL
ncbi:hypothetical protein Hdeb2414_s0007g00242831 [Helianthus debilis subsp. tardiflorus]